MIAGPGEMAHRQVTKPDTDREGGREGGVSPPRQYLDIFFLLYFVLATAAVAGIRADSALELVNYSLRPL